MCVFFKQKTAYEMRISDWSSDVCSSDLIESSSLRQRAAGKVECARHAGNGSSCAPVADRRDAPIAVGAAKLDQRNHIILSVPCRLRRVSAPRRCAAHRHRDCPAASSEESRVGKEGVRTCRSRGSPTHQKKKTE